MLKFLVDESSGRRLYNFLKDQSCDVKFSYDIIPAASDATILKLAEKEKRILITNYKDFGELVFRLKKPSSGVILLRLKSDNPQNRQKYLLYLLNKYQNSLYSNFVVISEKHIRIRNLN